MLHFVFIFLLFLLSIFLGWAIVCFVGFILMIIILGDTFKYALGWENRVVDKIDKKLSKRKK